MQTRRKPRAAPGVVKLVANLVMLVPFSLYAYYFIHSIIHKHMPSVMFVAAPGLLLWFGLGWAFYLGGFAAYSQFRKLEDMPRSTIRAAAMGLVEIQGKAVAETMLTSPVMHATCCAYRIRIEGRTPQEGRRPDRVEKLLQVEQGNFHLEDESGRILVDLRNLEWDMTPGVRMVNLQAEAEAEAPVLNRLLKIPTARAADDELRGYVREVVPDCHAPIALLYEDLIVPGQIYSLTGTCAETPQASGETYRKIMLKGQNDPTFRISPRTRDEEIKRLRGRAHILIGLGLAVAVVAVLFYLPFVLVFQ